MGGGSQSTTGQVVQYTAPWAAMLAGQVGEKAAAAAGQLATTQMSNAIANMNANYASAALALQPANQEGIQALDKLNSFIQLNPYNPSRPTAPVAPTAPTMLSGQMDPNTAYNYEKAIGQGGTISGFQNMLNNTGDAGIRAAFGADINAKGGLPNLSLGQLQAMKQNDPGKWNQFVGLLNESGAQGDNNAADIAANNQYAADLKIYNSQLPGYNLQLDNYNYAQDLKKQYDESGPMTAQQISDTISNQPGYQAQLAQGTDAIQKSAAAKGYLGSGRVLKELSNYGQNTLSQYYGDTLSRLSGLVASGNQAAGMLSSQAAQQGNSLAQLYSSLGDTQANATLAGGNARAQAITAANQQFKVLQTGSSSSDGGGIGSALGGIASIASSFANPAGLSSKALKEYVSTPSTAEILNNVRQLELDKWRYNGINAEHIGPYAEQFKELFNVGNGQSINMIDAIGVLIGAVKELDKKLNALTEDKSYGN